MSIVLEIACVGNSCNLTSGQVVCLDYFVCMAGYPFKHDVVTQEVKYTLQVHAVHAHAANMITQTPGNMFANLSNTFYACLFHGMPS